MSVTVPGKVLEFQNHTDYVPTFGFENQFTVTGVQNNLVYLQSVASGAQWMIDFGVPQTGVTYAFLRDGACAVSSYSVLWSGTNSGGGNNGSCWNIGNVGSDGTQTVTSVEMGSGSGTLRIGGAYSGGSSSMGGSGGGDLQEGGEPDGGGGATP